MVAAVRAVELICMVIAGKAFENHPDIEFRAIGNTAGSIADARLRYMLGLMENSTPTDEERIAAEHAIRVLGYLHGDEKPQEATDELWASVVWLDTRAKEGGVDGDSWAQALVRGVG